MNSVADGQPIPFDLQRTNDDTHDQQFAATSALNVGDSTPSRTPTTDTISTNPTNGELQTSTMPSADEVAICGSGTVSPEDAEGIRVAAQEDKDEPEIGPQPAMQEHIKEGGEAASLDHVASQMELLEHNTDAMIATNGVVVEDVQEWMPDADCELKRVKVYELVGSRWEDQGTAFCFGQFSEDTSEALLIARSEKNYNDVVLSTTIRSNDVYQRQQDNISSSPLIGSELSVTAASIYQSGALPQPRIGIIGEIERAIKNLARPQQMRERICEHIVHEDYIKQLIEVHTTAEDLEDLENLHALCSLMQTILMLNDHSMYEHILDDDLFFGVVGMLEYDPDFPDHKANYREFLNQQSHFHQPIPIRDFLKDVVLARALDDSTFNVLNSCIIFNQIDIIQHVQQDPDFLSDVVSLFIDGTLVSNSKKSAQSCPGAQQQGHLPPNQIIISLNGSHDDQMDVDPKPEERAFSNAATRQYYQTHYSWSPPDNMSEAEINLRREVIILIQQLCMMGKSVQLPARMALFRTLVERGILFAVQWALSLSEKEEANKSMISAAGEVLSTLLDHDLNGVRNHCMRHVDAILTERAAGKKGADKAESLLELLCKMMATSRDLAIQSQVGDALKAWLEVPPFNEHPAGGEAAGPPRPSLRKDGDVGERFIDYFYKNCVHTLFRPLLNLTEWKNVQGPLLPLFREEATRFTYLADLLHLFVAQHQFQSHLFVISTNILSRVASLLKAKDKHLRHDLIKFCMIHHEAEIRQLAKTPLGSQRFELFIQRYEINCEPPPPPSQGGPSERTVDPRAWAGPSRGMLDAEEEDYFNADDDDDANVISVNLQWQQQKPNTLLSSVPISGIKRKRRPGISAGTAGSVGKPGPLKPPQLRSPGLGSLLDYDDDDEESQEGESKDDTPTEVAIPPTPHLSAASLPKKQEPKPSQAEEDDDDDSQFFESLKSGPRSQSPAPPSGRNTLAPLRLGEKRRRNEDEDELLERLRKSKKLDAGPGSKDSGQVAVGANRGKPGDDPLKKIKVKLGPTGLSLALGKQPTPTENKDKATSPTESTPPTKDGDTG
ncbi:nuclear protein [Coprinopsis cinerea okayama7|uniref:Nuclear protein n=1 Tax=Coprinopsis cinerea (strain Okayama-7 / 130 / ATCC MYA-4618 / FGSC 9003) TaxID=240176 RepID=A8NYR5_COPC7|nr:nuclear protein [Coprinopsis cinerea okayama7\|eukprot:XP_001837500.2 nuclear protein [Coprinopsis cinerea okayama7\